jgi:hypothetical protein
MSYSDLCSQGLVVAEFLALVHALQATSLFRFTKLGSGRAKALVRHPRFDIVCYVTALLLSTLAEPEAARATLAAMFSESFVWYVRCL